MKPKFSKDTAKLLGLLIREARKKQGKSVEDCVTFMNSWLGSKGTQGKMTRDDWTMMEQHGISLQDIPTYIFLDRFFFLVKGQILDALDRNRPKHDDDGDIPGKDKRNIVRKETEEVTISKSNSSNKTSQPVVRSDASTKSGSNKIHKDRDTRKVGNSKIKERSRSTKKSNSR